MNKVWDTALAVLAILVGGVISALSIIIFFSALGADKACDDPIGLADVAAVVFGLMMGPAATYWMVRA